MNALTWLIDRVLTLFSTPLDIGNRAEINRRIRRIQGLDGNRCRALMVVPKPGD